MGRKCVILNGPPGCGKDTIAKLLGNHGFIQCENKEPMFRIAQAMTGISNTAWFDRYNDRDLKEVPWDLLGGKTQREFLIWISEEVMKPQLGCDIFGKLAANAAMRVQSDVVFSDGGFQPEMACLQEAFGKDNVILVHLFRDGFSFDGDSRNYLKPQGSPYLPLLLQNGKPADAVTEILAFINDQDHSF